jgi:CRISPR/Cas system CMR-associated protein Cmr5 small subunit
LIHYSDLSHLISILSWVISKITNKIQDDSKKYQTEKMLNNIAVHLKNYIKQERNESFHSRLQLYEIEELNNFLVDTRRTLETINKIMELIEH